MTWWGGGGKQKGHVTHHCHVIFAIGVTLRDGWSCTLDHVTPGWSGGQGCHVTGGEGGGEREERGVT